MNANAPTRPPNDPAALAIANVLRAESDARAAVAQAELAAQRIAEAARAEARTLAERTERRIRAVVGAFETDLAARLADIDAQAAGMATAHAPGDAELASLQRSVRALARQLTGAAL